jgi:hypothetical protein
VLSPHRKPDTINRNVIDGKTVLFLTLPTGDAATGGSP